LPAGTGKEIKVCVFADKEVKDQVMLAGADIFGSEDLIKSLTDGNIPFDKLIATPE
jgi:large subunit ribosomal protein L1